MDFDNSPKTSHRWILLSDDIEAFCLKNLKFPLLTARSGKAEFLTPLELEMYDPIAPNGAQKIMAACLKSSLEPLNLKVKQFDGTGIVVSTWTMLSRVIDVDFGKLDYSKTEPVIIKARFEVLDMTIA